LSYYAKFANVSIVDEMRGFNNGWNAQISKVSLVVSKISILFFWGKHLSYEYVLVRVEKD